MQRNGLARVDEAGLSLIELLVVLVVVALIATVLTTGLERVLDIRLRLAAFLDGTDAPTLVADWFRDTVRGIIADADTGRDQFTGKPRIMAALSLAPLNGTTGVPTRITWNLDYDNAAGRTYLRYRNGEGEPMAVASWPGDYGGFRYCGGDLKCHDTWPADQKSPQLPALVRLDAVKGETKWAILAAPASDPGAQPGSGRR
jgi:prepilin-type N-terminal cleavage/methylation domain-containing protein